MIRVMPYLIFWTVGSLLAILHHCDGQVCPDHIHVTIDGNRNYPDQDQVYLTSTLSGVNLDDMEYYWWLIHETNSPLYTYSDLYGIDEISKYYKGFVISANHSRIKGNFSSTIVFRHKEMRFGVYRCEFVLKDYSICAKTIRIENNEVNKRPVRVNHLAPASTHELTDTEYNISEASHDATNLSQPLSRIIRSRWSQPFQSPPNLSQTVKYAVSNFLLTRLSPSPTQNNWVIILLTVFTITIFLVILVILFMVTGIHRKIQTQRLSPRTEPSPELGLLPSNDGEKDQDCGKMQQSASAAMCAG